MNTLHKQVSDLLKKKGLHDEWRSSPSFTNALCLLGHNPIEGISRRDRRRKQKRILIKILRSSKVKPTRSFAASDEFLQSFDWRRLRMQALKRDGAKCSCCGATTKDGLKMHVDHIKPRLKYPELALELDNLQVLCEICNHGKGNWDETNWRDR